MAKLIISFITFILSLSFAFLYVMPAYKIANERRADIDSLTKVLNTSGEIKKLIDKTKKNLSSVEFEGLSRFKVFLPEKVDTVRFANNLQHIGKKNNIILTDIHVDEQLEDAQKKEASGINIVKDFVEKISIDAKLNQADGGGVSGAVSSEQIVPGEKRYSTTKASFTFSATYETFQLFLNDLEKSLGLVDVKSLSFTLAPDTTDIKKLKVPTAPVYQYLMTVETYSLK